MYLMYNLLSAAALASAVPEYRHDVLSRGGQNEFLDRTSLKFSPNTESIVARSEFSASSISETINNPFPQEA